MESNLLTTASMRLAALLLTCALLASSPSFGQGLDPSAAWTPLQDNRDVVPDTTSPWRYYPIAVGNRWEYYLNWLTAHAVEEIVGDTTIAGTLYFIYRGQFRIPPNHRNVWEFFIRYDPTSAIVVMRENADGPEVPFSRFGGKFFDCPFDSDFGSTCESFENWHVTGGYDVPVIVGGPPTGVAADTVTTSFKRFTSDAFGGMQVLDFAAGIGFTQWYEDEGGSWQFLYYARVDGVEYGESQFPVSADPAPEIEPSADARLEVWPNPASSRVSVLLTSPRSGEVTLSIVDMVGRVIQEHSHTVVAGVPFVAYVDVRHLPSGHYLILLRNDSITSKPISIVR